MTVDSTPDLRQVWQAQPDAVVPTSLAEVRERSQQLAQRVRRRNTREYLAGTVAVALFGAQGVAAPNRIVAVGCALAVAGVLYVMYQLSLRGTTRAPAEYGETGCVAFHRAELVRERDLLQSVWRWYLGPLVPGGAIMLTGRALAQPDQWSRALVVGAICAVVFAAIWRLNTAAARRLQQSIDALDADGHHGA